MKLSPCISYKEQTHDHWHFLHIYEKKKNHKHELWLINICENNAKQRDNSIPVAGKSCREVEKAARDSKPSPHFPDCSDLFAVKTSLKTNSTKKGSMAVYLYVK